MITDRALYYGYTVLLISMILLITALVLTQTVKIDIEADATARLGDIITDGNADTPELNIPKYSVSNPLDGEETTLYDGTVMSIPAIKVKSSFDGFNLSVHAKGRIEAPVYILALAYLNKDKISDEIKLTVVGKNS